MPVVPMREILDRAFAERYGVAAINIVDDLSLAAVLAAATELEAPLIVQTSLKTVKSLGTGPLMAIWRARAAATPVPVTLHLDHCPDREWITRCLDAGWNSVLFDGSELDVAENTRQTIEVVAEAPIPMVLHGGTGLGEEQFADLIARGCAKVNISTALKIAFVDAHREYLDANPGKHDPPGLLEHVRAAVKDMAERHIRMFGSAGKARAFDS